MTGTSFYGIEKHVEGLTGGSTQAETRLYNERLILALIRRRASLSKVELARMTGLSPQTVSTIVNQLVAAGFLAKGEPLRGRLGQPTVPFSLNPAGAYSFGLNIGRRGADLMLIDFVGTAVAHKHVTFAYPTPSTILAFARETMASLLAERAEVKPARIAGLGIASAFEMWNWPDATLPAGSLTAWREVDVRAELDRELPFPVYLLSDTMMAAGAELMFGCGEASADFLAVYVSHFIGGGLVLDHKIFPGSNKRAAAIGDAIVPVGGRPRKLNAVASLHALSARVDGGAGARESDDSTDLGSGIQAWIEDAAEGIAITIANAAALIDLNTAVIDGALPADVKKALVKAVRQKAGELLVDRPEPFTILDGRFGALAPSLGAAAIPLLVNYSNDRDVLFKDWDANAARVAAESPALLSAGRSVA